MKLKTSVCVDVSTYSAYFDDSTCLYNVLTRGNPVCCFPKSFAHAILQDVQLKSGPILI